MNTYLEKKLILSALWIFASINWVFCDVVSLMEQGYFQALVNGGIMDGMAITEEFLFMFAVMLEISFLMIVLSLVLKYKANRIVNVIAGIYMAIIQTGSLFAGSNTMHYWFFSFVEIGAYLVIIIYALKWKNQEV